MHTLQNSPESPQPGGNSANSALPLRVKLVAPSLDILGGQSIQAWWLRKRLRCHPVDVELVPINPRLPGPFRILQGLRYVRTLVTLLWYFLLLFMRLRTADVVHVFSASYLSFLLAPTPAVLIGKWVYGKRVVIHYHSGEAEDHLERWPRTALPVLRAADLLVVPSKYLQEIFGRHGLQAEVIPNFIDETRFAIRRRGQPAPQFLANRNLEPLYNVACVLRAFRRIQDRYPGASLTVAGDGSERASLERLARDLSLNHVRFLGQVRPEVMPDLYSEAEIYLNASNVDNQPLSILESFAVGVPVVSTSAGGIRHLVDHGRNGLLVPPNDDEALARQAIRLIEEPGLGRTLVRAAYRDFVEVYRWDAVRDNWLDLYSKLTRHPLRIGIVAPSIRILGGQSVQAKRLLDRLSEVPELRVSLVPVDPQLPPGLRLLQRVKYLRTVVTELRYLASLFRRIRHFDVVHVFSASYFSFVLAPLPAVMISRLYGKRTVLNYRSGEAGDHLRRWRRTAVPAIRKADRVVVGSGYLQEVFTQFDIGSETIPNIVHLDRYTFRHREPLRPAFIANRNLEPHYDVATILRAFRDIQQRHPDATLVIAGDGSERRRLESLAADLELAGVTFLGKVPPQRMPDLFEKADIYLNASLVDNMPTSLIEAFAAGLPVVTTSAGGIPHIVRHEENGLLVPPGDDEALAREALRLLHDPRLSARLVNQGREDCERLYTWPRVRSKWLGLYNNLLGGELTPRLARTTDRPSVIGRP